MQRGDRLLLFAGMISFPALFIIGMLFFQLKRIDILTRDTEAELQLAKQKRVRLEREKGEPEEDAAPAAASVSEQPQVSEAAGPS